MRGGHPAKSPKFKKETAEMANMDSKNRLAFLDNLRTLMVLLVLVFHSANSYGVGVPFWPFHERNPSTAINLFMFLVDSFAMAILFFIAGYFALPSLKKGGAWHFLKSKYKRLVLPWLIITILLLPMLDYVHYRNNAANAGLVIKGYAEHWFFSIKRIAEFKTGWMNMSAYTDMTEHFYQRYMWFISLLFLFYVVFMFFYPAGKKLFGRAEPLTDCEAPSNWSVFRSLALTAFVTVLFFGLVKFFLYSDFRQMGWFSLGNVIQFQCGKLVIYATYFGLGIYACSRKWFTEVNKFGRPWLWGLGCFLLFGIMGFVMKHFGNGAETASIWIKLAAVVVYPLWTLSFLGLFLSFTANRHWSRYGRINRELADNSYNMYLVHYIFPMTIPLFLSTWTEGPVFVKFGIVTVATLLLSHGISRFIVKPFPRFTVIVLVCLSLLLAVGTRYF